MKKFYLYAAVLYFLFPTMSIAQQYDCTPNIKYECSKDKCERITEDFQHAEGFTYDKKKAKLSACLWTNCYSGKASAFEDKASKNLTVIGRLTPSHTGNEPITASLTIDSTGNFTAIWNYGSEGLTFDMGKCVLKK